MYTPPQCVVTQYHSMSHMALRIVSFSMLIPLSKKPKTTRVSRDASDSRPDVTMEIGPSRSTPSLRAVMYRSLAYICLLYNIHNDCPLSIVYYLLYIAITNSEIVQRKNRKRKTGGWFLWLWLLLWLAIDI